MFGMKGKARNWREVYKEIRGKFPGWRKARIDKKLSDWLVEKLDHLKTLFVENAVGDELVIAREWTSELEQTLIELTEELGIEGVLFPHELRSFIADPEAHLRKKLFIYAMDLARGKLKPSSFEVKARQAVQTSLQTNLRNIYQSWVFLTVIRQVSGGAGSLIYPEHGYLSLERSGRQRLSLIPPNAVIQTRAGALSFFLEAPRPIAWEDTEDLRRVWRLYKAMRPDILIYGGMVMNILEDGGDPPIKRPDVIIECKELEDWYKRSRELRGGDKPLSAEEWRWMWLQGLWKGLGKELGARVKPEKLERGEGKKIRVKEPQLLKAYANLYKPKKMMLVTRCPTPDDVKRELEDSGIEVIDDVRLNPKKLRKISEELLEYAEPAREIIVLKGPIVILIEEESKALKMTPEELIKKAVKNFRGKALNIN